MPQEGLIIRVLVASPSDCAQERRIIPEEVSRWNAIHSYDSAAVIETVMWETHSRPEFGGRPQAIINKQLLERCDLLVGTFWTRLGTPTGAAESGTAEEIEEFRAAGKPVLLYFSSAPVVPDSLDQEQYSALRDYRNRLSEEGLLSFYDSPSHFREQFQRHLSGTMVDMLRAHSREPQALSEDKDREGDERRLVVEQFLTEFEAFMRRLNAEWRSERDSDPMNTDDGKFILSKAADEVVHFRSMITSDAVGLSETMDEALRRLRSIQRHQTYLDGGASFREFWDQGDQIIQLLETVPPKIRLVLDEDSTEVHNSED